jgi:hypothetical protein
MKNFVILFFFLFSRVVFCQALPNPAPSVFLTPVSTTVIANNWLAANSPSFTVPGVVTNSAGSLVSLRSVPYLALIGVAATALLVWTKSASDDTAKPYQVTRVVLGSDISSLSLPSRVGRKYFMRIEKGMGYFDKELGVYVDAFDKYCQNQSVPAIGSCDVEVDLPSADWYSTNIKSAMVYRAVFTNDAGKMYYDGANGGYSSLSFNTMKELCEFYKGSMQTSDDICEGFLIPDYIRSIGYTHMSLTSFSASPACPVPYDYTVDIDYEYIYERYGQQYVDNLQNALNEALRKGLSFCYSSNPRRLSDGVCDYVNNRGSFFTEDVDCRQHYDGGSSGASTMLRDGHVVSYGQDSNGLKTIVDVSPSFQSGKYFSAPSFKEMRVSISEETELGINDKELVIQGGKVISVEGFELPGAEISVPDTIPSTELSPSITTSLANTPAVRYSLAPDAGTSPGVNPGAEPGGEPNTNPIEWPDDYARRGEAEDAADKIVDAVMGDGEDIPLDVTVTDFDSSFFNGTFDNLSAWRVPNHSSQCPVGSFDVFDKTFLIDSHCALVQDYFSELSAAMIVVFSVLALFIVLRA